MKTPCGFSSINYDQKTLELPNCDDPVFRTWCQACGLQPGISYSVSDLRLARLEEIMHAYDPSYDPEQDTADNYLDPF